MVLVLFQQDAKLSSLTFQKILLINPYVSKKCKKKCEYYIHPTLNKFTFEVLAGQLVFSSSSKTPSA
jgi:hypothetical protein